MDALWLTIIAVILPLILTLAAYAFHFLTGKGAAAAFLFAAFIGITGGIWWELAFLAMPAASFAATKVDFREKKAEGVQEGRRGERSWKNIAGVSIAPALVAALTLVAPARFEVALIVAFISAIAVSTADTVASEIGVADPHVWMITTLKPTTVGVNGGVSRAGLLSSLVAALAFAFVAWVLIAHNVKLPFVVAGLAGMAGNLLDSVLGATLENQGHISKFGNNAVTALCGALLGGAIAAVFWPI